ncbi:ankyrin repeat domain-containing protein SOWAHC [Rana temporaria]|uniref:ankyrin repeat domain-containing protein SOWAHC n=1 Tax=Rana temporaria TaxID=8407 RepID=UPI001AAC76CC|nr:ankyrin repeat domain-containing protein SOWAHC [Rana temporaria]XP_040192322.1 ankyrin repeat domain-containing protein SOWAHC [Rana temporaria]XP_040192323.1 ankyrin repeat domain-containing protein SOWAHC [Rana temporaria]XP_040192324.1 ankyrin repeat domain-containing protein SOWAHC [Rana temporaria]
MSELSRDTVIGFLLGKGGRIPNQQLVEHFRPVLTEPPPGEARNAARQLFKDIVNEVASVRAEDGVKYVCLRKRYRSAAEQGETQPATGEGAEPGTGEEIKAEPGTGEEIKAEPGTGEEIKAEPGTGEEIPAEPGIGKEIPAEPGTGEEISAGTGESIKAEASTGEDEGVSPDSSPGEESPQSDPPRISVTEEDGEKIPKKTDLSGRTSRNSRRGPSREPVSPQLRRGAGGVLLRAALRDSDSSSVHSSSSVSGNEEEESGGGSVSLEPLEHAWMLSSCRARWDGLRELLMAEPGLITRRDFITGFSCLHWAAKHGQHELLAALLTHARQHRLPVNINGRASGGYTPLHLAAMHGHLDVIKLLVGAYDADVDVRDYSGRKAWQYLSPDTARDVQALTGAVPGPEEDEEEDGASSGSGRWRLSKVLPTQLIVHRLGQLPEDEQDGGGRHRADITRKGSGGSRGRPRLNRIRFRTQIIHSNLSPRDPEDEDDRSLKSPIRHRPKSNVFG